MELEFTRTDINHYELVQDTVCSREETLEMIVPDACPDIMQVTDTYGFCCLTRREITDSGAMLAGTVKAAILYVPEGAAGLWKLEAELPFQHLSDSAQTDSSCRLLAEAEIVTSETRIINPRKILIRVDLRETIRVYQPQVLSVCSGIAAQPEHGIQQQQEHYQATFAMQLNEKTFSMEEDLTLPGSKPVATSILRIQPSAYCSEARLIGSKLVLKGGVLLKALCRGEDGEVYFTDFDLPLSQIMESGGAGEESVFQVRLRVIDWQTGPLSTDGRSLSISLELAAQAVFYENLPIALITDAYSLRYPLTLQTENQSFQRLTDCDVQRQTIREFLESEISVKNICDTHMELGTVQIGREEEQCTLSVPATVTVLFISEEGRYTALNHTFHITLQKRLPKDAKISCHYALNQLEALPGAAGIELRGVLEFQLQTRQTFQVTCLSGSELDREHPLDHSGQPSVILRRPGKGERLWEIAKRYSTTCQEICAANGLAEDQLLGDQMLLIPRKR